MRRERTRARRGLSAVLACCWACAVLAAAPASLQEQLRNLATQRGFTVEGLGRLGEAPPGNAGRRLFLSYFSAEIRRHAA